MQIDFNNSTIPHFGLKSNKNVCRYIGRIALQFISIQRQQQKQKHKQKRRETCCSKFSCIWCGLRRAMVFNTIIIQKQHFYVTILLNNNNHNNMKKIFIFIIVKKR